MTIETIQCWCGSKVMRDFSQYYWQCQDCHTLICKRHPEEYVEGRDDNFYGEHYWTKFVKEEYGMPDITERARNDLAERCIFWLRTIFQYKLPPAKTLELGCSHGGLVFLMKQAGYDSIGEEVSQWICDFAHKTFQIPMLCGKIEDLNIVPHTYDIIIMMDVLEHLTDPVRALQAIHDALKEDGLVVIQTPCFREIGKTVQELQTQNSPFLPMLAEKEHVYLFNQIAMSRLLTEAGFSHAVFEPQFFPYDMFVFAGKQEIQKREELAAAEVLLKTPESRSVMALIDLYEKKESMEDQLRVCEKDRTTRLKVIERQSEEFTEKMRVVETDRIKRLEVINRLQNQLTECEKDRAARLKVIERQTKEFAEKIQSIEADRAARLEVINRLQKQLTECEKDRAAQLNVTGTQAATFAEKISEMEAEKNEHIATIEKQRQEIDSILNNLPEKCAALSREDESLLKKCLQIEEREEQINRLKSSRSWRITAPLRRIRRKLKFTK
jgi:2-polyprenyl-3-methyl-5-hydroxy-6-metoxy-1,4-benzoquinol methylase